MQYRVVEATELQALSNEVNSYIKNGWEPQGGVCIAIIQGTSLHYRYTQAIIHKQLNG